MLRLRHTCAGGVREAGVQQVPECIAEPANCTSIVSQEVSDTHKGKQSCWAECLDGFRPASYPVMHQKSIEVQS